MKIEIGQNVFQKEGFSAFAPHYFPPKGLFELTQSILIKAAEADHLVGKLDGGTHTPPPPGLFFFSPAPAQRPPPPPKKGGPPGPGGRKKKKKKKKKKNPDGGGGGGNPVKF